MVAPSLCPVGRLVCSEPCTGLLSIQRSSNEHYKHTEKAKTKRQPKRSQDNGYSTKGTQISSAYSFVILAILFAAPFHRSSKWLAARCLMASRFLVFSFFGVVLARSFFPSFRLWIPKRCKGVHCVDLGESFPTHISLQNLASIQPRTSPSKLG